MEESMTTQETSSSNDKSPFVHGYDDGWLDARLHNSYDGYNMQGGYGTEYHTGYILGFDHAMMYNDTFPEDVSCALTHKSPGQKGVS